MKLPLQVIVPVMVLALSSCTLGPDYKRPDLIAPKKWNQMLQNQGNSSYTIEWWENFNDKILEKLIQDLSNQNLDLKLAESLIEQSRSFLAAADANFLPTISSNASLSVNETSQSYSSSNTRSRQYNLYSIGSQVSWEIDIFGQLKRSKEAAIAGFMGQIENSYGVFLSLAAQMAQNYLGLRSVQQQHLLQKQITDTYKKIYNLTLNLEKNGLVSAVEVENAKSTWHDSASLLPDLKAAIKNYMHSLAILTGQHPQALYALLSPIGFLPQAPHGIFLGLPSELLERRPDIRKAEMDLKKATASIGVAKSSWFPSFFLTGGIGYEGLKPSFITPSNLFYNVGPNISWNIFDFGKTKAQIMAAEALQTQEAIAYRNTILKAFSEVESGLVLYAQELKKLDVLEKVKNSQAKIMRMTKSRYQAGLETEMTFLQSKVQLLNSQINMICSQEISGKNSIYLYKALGGGWENYAWKKSLR